MFCAFLLQILNIPGDSKTIDLRSAIIDIAYELLHCKDDQRAHVLRVVTQKRTEHLLQAARYHLFSFTDKTVVYTV